MPPPPPKTWIGTVFATVLAIVEIVYAWMERIYNSFNARSDEDRLTDDLRKASTYHEWWRAAIALDRLPARYNWRANPIDDLYDYRHLDERLQELKRLRRYDKPVEAVNYLRHGLLRNLFNITKFSLFDKTYTTTKGSIQAYLEESLETIKYITESPVALTSSGGRLTAQAKLEALHESKVTFGSTALLLQGGSIFGLCHLGVVKALLEHGILPKVIVGTATGALMAALVGIHTAEELPGFLHGDSIDLSAFKAASEKARERTEEHIELLEDRPPKSKFHNWYYTFERRARRLMNQGFLLDPVVLADSVEANVGDLTFEEAYQRTGRILNIIISSPSEEIPNLMNYLTAPHVLIRSAAMASHVTNMARYKESPIQLLHKDVHGVIRAVDVQPTNPKKAKARRPPSAADRKTPLTRLKQLFNVDHFIISQARPYVAPFVKPSLPYIRKSSSGWNTVSRRFGFWKPNVSGTVKHVMLLADILGFLPDGLRRILSDETVKGDSLTVVPEVQLSDWTRLLKNPTKDEIDFWIMRGERSVWSSLCALKVRCVIEVALEQAHERARRRRRPSDPLPPLLSGLHASLTPPLDPGLFPMLTLNSAPLQNPFEADVSYAVDSSGGEEEAP